MKRNTPLRRKTPLRAKRRTLRREGKSTVAQTKKRIQALLRENVIKRDGGCVLRVFPEAGRCGPEKADGTLILQAEHLNGRANSISYGEMDNIVCLCMNHHIFFKKRNSALYWMLIEEVVGPERWKKIQGWIRDRSPHKFVASDWQRLEEQLKEY